MFRFVLRGDLIGNESVGLRNAWIASQSILGNKDLIVDVSGVTTADASGFKLLSQIRQSGGRLVAASPPASEQFLNSLGVPVMATARHRANAIARWARAIKRAVELGRYHRNLNQSEAVTGEE